MKIARSFLSLRKKVLRRSTKKAKKEAKARKRIAALHKKLDSLGPHLEIATDGSSIPNPGPTGAGYVMREVDYGSNDYTFFSSTSLGHGTNNLGEIKVSNQHSTGSFQTCHHLESRSSSSLTASSR